MGLNKVCWSTMIVDGIVSCRTGHSAYLPMLEIREDGWPNDRYIPLPLKYGPIDEDRWLQDSFVRGLYEED